MPLSLRLGAGLAAVDHRLQAMVETADWQGCTGLAAVAAVRQGMALEILVQVEMERPESS